jgi:hypothetical protein
MRLNITHVSVYAADVKFESLPVCVCFGNVSRYQIRNGLMHLWAQFYKFVRWNSCFLIDYSLLFQVSFRGVTCISSDW